MLTLLPKRLIVYILDILYFQQGRQRNENNRILVLSRHRNVAGMDADAGVDPYSDESMVQVVVQVLTTTTTTVKVNVITNSRSIYAPYVRTFYARSSIGMQGKVAKLVQASVQDTDYVFLICSGSNARIRGSFTAFVLQTTLLHL